ncbi:MAG: hypothetical protein ACTHZX_07095 [Microbacterium sp.]
MNLSVPVHPPESDVPAPQDPAALLRQRVPRESLLDRAVLRVGIALLIWSTRPAPEHTPHISELALDPRSPLYAARAADTSFARGALLHGVHLLPPGR